MPMWGYTAAGFLVGFLIAGTGVGGGSVMSPLLIGVFRLSPAVAVGTDLLFAAGAKGFATLFHGSRGSVEWGIVGLLASGSIPATVLTLAGLSFFNVAHGDQSVIVVVLGLTITLTGILTLARRPIRRWAKRAGAGHLRRLVMRHRRVATVVAGIAIGTLVTLSSVGGGVIGTMALFVLYPELAAVSVVGTELAHALLLTTLAGLGQWVIGTPNITVTLWLLLGAAPGVYLGTAFGLRLPDRALRPVIAGLLVVAGVGLLV